MASGPSSWFAVRRDLSPGKRLALTVASFVLPLALWCVVSYVPWIWHPDVKLELSAERENITTIYTAGDHVSKEYFPQFVADVRAENKAVTDARAAGAATTGAKRKNQKLLRQLAPLAIANGWLPRGDEQNDAVLFTLWRDLATGAKVSTRPVLTAENLGIIRDNWTRLSEQAPEFAFKTLPDAPLLKLVPQGKRANPSYLPAPHEVAVTGWHDFTTKPENDAPTMMERYKASLRVIFLGFLWACALGIPIGILCGVFDCFSRLFEPFIDFFRYMPAPTFSTLLVAVLLAGDAPKVALIFIGTFFQLVLVIAKTTRLLDPALLEAAQTLGAKPRQLVTRVVLPGILPNLYNDLRILLGWAWTWLVIAELIGVKSGLTEFIETQGRFRNFDRVFPVIILIGITGFVTDQILSWLHGLLFPWAGKSDRFSRGLVRGLGGAVRYVTTAIRQPAPAPKSDSIP